MDRDPAYIASQVKFVRKMFGLTQENLANAAGLTTCTIEKVESGRRRPEEQTLRSLARALIRQQVLDMRHSMESRAYILNLSPHKLSLLPNSLIFRAFSKRYGEPDSWFESCSRRHEISN